MSLSFSHTHQQGNGTTEVVAVLIAVVADEPMVLTVGDGKLLPNGPLMPLHRSLQAGVRQWVEEQTKQPLGYIEQLYTFVDTNRRSSDGHALIYVSYMGLLTEADIVHPIAENLVNINKVNNANNDLSDTESNHIVGNPHNGINHQLTNEHDEYIENGQVKWRSWYDYFPWENRRHDESSEHVAKIIAALQSWASDAPTKSEQRIRQQRIALCWGHGLEQGLKQGLNQNNKQYREQREKQCEWQSAWIAEHALLRYEMLYEAGLIPESPTYHLTLAQLSQKPHDIMAKSDRSKPPMTGEPMFYDHRRVIATAIARLRAKIEYRPLIFGVMPDEFTLLQLQHSVEALTGVGLHKQNFRRLLANQDLLEETGNFVQPKRGRPAKLFRFKFDVGLHSLLMNRKLPKK